MDAMVDTFGTGVDLALEGRSPVEISPQWSHGVVCGLIDSQHAGDT